MTCRLPSTGQWARKPRASPPPSSLTTFIFKLGLVLGYRSCSSFFPGLYIHCYIGWIKQHWHYQQKQHHQQIGFWVVTSPVTEIKKNKDGSDEKWFSSVTVKSVQPKNGDKRCNLEPFTPKQRDSAPIWSHCPILVTNLAVTFVKAIK